VATRSLALAALGAAVAAMAAMAAARALAGSGRARPPRRRRDPAPREIAPGVLCLGPWGRTQTNVYLVRAGSGWFLVDAGWEGDAARIASAARRLLGPGISPTAILLTHAHPDHEGASRALAEAWGCPILAHPAELPIAHGDFAAMERWAGPLDRWVILPAMRAIGERRRTEALARGSLAGLTDALPTDGTITGMDGWAWIATPGHTPGHVSFVRPDDRVVLTGDALLTLRVNTLAGLLVGRQGLSGPPWYTTWDRRAAAASITAIGALEPSVVGGGHGRPIGGPGTTESVRDFARRVAARGH
jgi:glyoxylase-like metal-dependent hydrolase (beta-lactamase superfamily II)